MKTIYSYIWPAAYVPNDVEVPSDKPKAQLGLMSSDHIGQRFVYALNTLSGTGSDLPHGQLVEIDLCDETGAPVPSAGQEAVPYVYGRIIKKGATRSPSTLTAIFGYVIATAKNNSNITPLYVKSTATSGQYCMVRLIG